MKKILSLILALGSLSSFSSTELGMESKICKLSQELASARVDLVSNINFKGSEYIALEQSGSAEKYILEKKLKKLNQANKLSNALDVFCQD